MTTFTKEQLIEMIKRNITVMERYPDLVTAQMDLEVYKIALASLEAEPVAEIRAFYPTGVDGGKQKFIQVIGELPDFGGHLYATPPVPVVPEEIGMSSLLPVMSDQLEAVGYVKGWNACRAVMLQGDKS
ncbi:hypothetical protein [Escherichia coli]|uniref:hypothetical protein n=1 Tax=Escherichia coli TaxID=562 RepID=UPI0039089166